MWKKPAGPDGKFGLKNKYLIFRQKGAFDGKKLPLITRYLNYKFQGSSMLREIGELLNLLITASLDAKKFVKFK